METVQGENRGEIILYALSTCGWCKKTRTLLEDLGVEYSYIYVDKLSGEEREAAKQDVMKWNPRMSFPTVVLNGETVVVGFSEERIREALGV